MLKQTIESTDRARVLLEFGDEKSLKTNLGSFRDVVYGHVRPGAMGFSVHWNLPKPLQVTRPEDSTQTLFSTQQLTFACEWARTVRSVWL